MMLKKACSVPVVDKEFMLSERKKHPAHSILLHVRNYLFIQIRSNSKQQQAIVAEVGQ